MVAAPAALARELSASGVSLSAVPGRGLVASFTVLGSGPGTPVAALRPFGVPAFGEPQTPFLATPTRIFERRRTGTDRYVDLLVAVSGGALQTVARRVQRGRAQLAANARGDAAVIWVDDRGGGGPRVAVALRRPGGRFGAPSILVGRAHSLPDGYASIELAFARTGRAVLAYDTQDVGEEGNTPYVVRTAILAPGADRFADGQTLESSGPTDRPLRTVYLAVAPSGPRASSGRPSAARRITIRVARATAAGRFGASSTLTPSGTPADLEVAPDGTTIAVWTPDDASAATGLQAALAAPAAPAFAPAEDVTAGSVLSGDAAATFDPTTGRPTVVWSTGRRVFAADRLP